MASENDTQNNSSLLQDVKASQKLYADNVTHGQRFSAAFDTTKVLGSDGKLFGVPVSEGASNTIRLLINQVLPHLADYAGNKSTELAQNIAKNVLRKTDAAEIAKIGRSWGKGIAYGTIFIQPIAETAANLYQTTKLMGELRSAVAPIVKANGYSPTVEGILSDANNEVIANARSQIFQGTLNDMVSTVARSIALVPSFYMLHGKQKAKLLAAEQDAELELLAKGGSPEEYQNYIKKHMTASGNLNTENAKQLSLQINSAQKEYMANFETFKKSNERNIEREVIKDLENGLEQYYVEHYNIRGFNKDHNKKYDSVYKVADNKKADPEKLLIKEIVKAKVKEKYVEQNMPWDENWLSPDQLSHMRQRGSTYKPQTLKGTIEEAHHKVMERLNEKVQGAKNTQHGKGGEQTGDALLNQGILGAASLAGELVEGLATGKANKELKEDIALNLIMHLRRSIDENPQRERIPGKKNKSEEYSYAMFVHKIFQQHQHDCGQSEIGERDFNNLKEDSWSDTAIQKRKDAELSAYEVAIKHISQYIRDGRMDPLALINLVGERKIVASSGKSFGTLKTGDENDLKKSITAEIDKQCALLKPQHHMTQNEISEALANYSFSQEELKAALSPSGLKGEERAFLFTLIDTHTPDDDALKALTGLKDADIKALRVEAQAHFTTMITAAVQEIAEEIKASPHAMKKYKITQDEAKNLMHMYEKCKEEGVSVVDGLNSSMRRDIETAVANVIMHDGMKENQTLWQQKIKPRMNRLLDDALNEEKHTKDVISESFAERVTPKTRDDVFLEDNMPHHQHGFDHAANDHTYRHAGRHHHARADFAPGGIA